MKASFIPFFAYLSILLLQILVLNCNPVFESLDDSIRDSTMDRKKHPRIINGTRTSRGDYPFMVSLRRNNGSFLTFCGASILDRNHVITAAHCVEDEVPENVLLFFGQWNQAQVEPGEAVRHSLAFLIHPQYNSNFTENDIALITLNETLEFTNSIQPICLTVQPAVPGEKAYVMGWGYTRGTEDYTYLQVI